MMVRSIVLDILSLVTFSKLYMRKLLGNDYTFNVQCNIHIILNQNYLKHVMLKTFHPRFISFCHILTLDYLSLSIKKGYTICNFKFHHFILSTKCNVSHW
jgi:hypothetical protein